MLDHPLCVNPQSVLNEDKETKRQGNKERGSHGEKRIIALSLSPCLPLSLSFAGMERRIVAAYNRPMPESRTTTGIFLVVLLAVVGYVLWTMPYKLIDGYTKAAELSPWVGYAYLAIVGIGGLLLGGGVVLFFLPILWDTRQKK